MTGETLPRVMSDYVADFDREFFRNGTPSNFEGSRSFFSKWKLLIELTTGVHMMEIRGLHAFALANVAAMKCRRLTSGP